MSFNVSAPTCGDGASTTGVSGMLLTSVFATLLHGACKLSDPSSYPPDKGYNISCYVL
jgi:hypothetical protein